jgi:hypothetical protein
MGGPKPNRTKWPDKEESDMPRMILVVLLVLVSTGCARVPVEVKTAMEKQAKELQQIKEKHRESVDILFAQIRTLQLYILNEKEKEFQQRYARGPKAAKLESGKDVLIYRDPDTKKTFPPLDNPDLDLIAISTSRLISDWFAAERAKTEDDLLRIKEEFLKLEGHVEIAQQINAAVTEYLDSLVNLRRAQKELANNLTTKLGLISGVAQLQSTVLTLLKPPTTSELENKLKNAGS